MKISKSFKLILGIIVLLPFALSALARPLENAAAETRLTQSLNNLQTMQADFVQDSYDIHGKVLQRSTGIMALQRPGKFYWNIKVPIKQLYIADGTYLWTYDADLAQATRQPLNKSKNNNPAYLLSGSVGSLQKRFIVGEIGQWFILKPKGKDVFRSIELHFQNNQLNAMKLYDNLGQLSTFTFSNIRVNAPINQSLFQFAPPKAVDVIKQ